jgi:hypothetical protein
LSTPLFPNRDPQGETDPILDIMLREVLQRRQQKAVVVTQAPEESVRDYALRHGWPLPQPERFKWAKCLTVVLCAVLGTLLLDRLLEMCKLESTLLRLDTTRKQSFSHQRIIGKAVLETYTANRF